jgi:hypothetical protein
MPTRKRRSPRSPKPLPQPYAQAYAVWNEVVKPLCCPGWGDFWNFFSDLGPRFIDSELTRSDPRRGYHCGICKACLTAGHERNGKWSRQP